MRRHYWILFLFLFFCVPLSSYAGDNACINCHSGLSKVYPAGKAFLEWEKSVHDKSGVSCDRCHGGNPAAQTQPRAHQGISGPHQSGALLHENRILKVCGACHEPQLKEFTQSRHYKVLLAEKGNVQGPTCMTCHGSMHTAILAPDNVAEACARCHNTESRLAPNVPEEAHATLDLIFYAKNTIKWSREFVALAKKQGYSVVEAEEALKEAEEKFRRSEIKWHSFDFHEILKLVDQTYELAKKAKQLADEEVTRGTLKKITEQR